MMSAFITARPGENRNYIESFRYVGTLRKPARPGGILVVPGFSGAALARQRRGLQ